MPSPKKPSAADRTIDIFSGRSKAMGVEDVAETVAAEDVADGPKVGETIEQSAERWRANCFWTAEYFSKNWEKALPEGLSKFRITERGDLMLLERFMADSGGMAAGWTGVMFKPGDLYELTSVFVKASKERQAKGV